MEEQDLDQEEKILTPDAAVDLWQKGKDEWNAWLEENPQNVIDFTGVNFCNITNGEISFKGYQFPCNKVKFNKANFARVKKINFEGINFSTATVSFIETNLSGGLVFFDGCTFRDDVHFNGAVFGTTYTSFKGVTFSENASFSRASFSTSCVDFSFSSFMGDRVEFSDVNAKRSDIYFTGSIFKNIVLFDNSKFKSLKFDYVGCQNVKRFSFYNSSMEQPLNLSGIKFGCVPDLRFTDAGGKISLDGLICGIHYGSKDYYSKTESISMCRTLKLISEKNKNHDGALYFHSLEMRSKRGVRHNKAASLLDWVFDKACNYGQSIATPFLIFIISTIYYGHLYLGISANTISNGKSIWKIFAYSSANNPLFLSFSRGSKDEVLKIMFGNLKGELVNVPAWIDFIFISQNLISVTLLFLIVLGLRNRFRI